MSAGWEHSNQPGSVSVWIRGLRTGHESAAALIFQRYRDKLQGVANKALGSCSRRVSDEEDVVISAFCAFLRRSQGGAYSELSTRADLWRLLATITRTYAWKQSRFLHRIKRNPTSEVADSNHLLSSLASAEASPEMIASMSETLSNLLRLLDAEDPTLKSIAIGRLEGLTKQELASELDCSVRTIERRLLVIQTIWKSHFEPAS
ncbi:MAG: ECF-type sigma factor [Planctomycetaceae bacterium]